MRKWPCSFPTIKERKLSGVNISRYSQQELEQKLGHSWGAMITYILGCFFVKICVLLISTCRKGLLKKN